MWFNTSRYLNIRSRDSLFCGCFLRLDLSWCLWTESLCTESPTCTPSTSSEKPSATRPKTPCCLWSKSPKTFKKKRLNTDHEFIKISCDYQLLLTQTGNSGPNSLMSSEVILPFMLKFAKVRNANMDAVDCKTNTASCSRSQDFRTEWREDMKQCYHKKSHRHSQLMNFKSSESEIMKQWCSWCLKMSLITTQEPTPVNNTTSLYIWCRFNILSSQKQVNVSLIRSVCRCLWWQTVTWVPLKAPWTERLHSTKEMKAALLFLILFIHLK